MKYKDYKYYVNLVNKERCRISFNLRSILFEFTETRSIKATLSKIVDGLKRVAHYRLFALKNRFFIEDTFSLDESFALFLLPRLAYLRDNTISYPPFITMKQWRCILCKIINGFELYVNKASDPRWTDEERKLWKDAMNLFVKYFSDLWD